MSTLVAQTISNGTVSTSSANVIQGSAKAWVNFNGISGSVAIRASYNVSSITQNASGIYTINFNNAMPDANYATIGATRYPTANNQHIVTLGLNDGTGTYSTSAVQIRTVYTDTANIPQDCSIVSVAVFR